MLKARSHGPLEETFSHKDPLSLSNGEIHFLWWFIQGGIMCPSTRERLWNAWGMCERHAWGFIFIEAAFREGYMHGPAILYEDLIHRAVLAVSHRGAGRGRRIGRRLREKGPCLMCDLGYGPNSKGAARPELVEKGRDPHELLSLAADTALHWQDAVCGKCAGTLSSQRCRQHLSEDLKAGTCSELPLQLDQVLYLHRHIERYAASFCYGYPGERTPEDVAALISSVGWCSGWGTFLALLK